MPWNYDKSLERIQSHLDDLDGRGLTVSKLARKSENLENLLSETDCREIYGAHVYGEVANFSRLSSAPILQANDYKKFLRSLHVYQAELSRLIEQSFDAYFVHFQGDRFHALVYRPIDEPAAIANKALLLQLAARDWVGQVFNPHAKFDGAFSFAAGADIGTVIGTRNGPQGGRELLFLGPPANNAAKLITTQSLSISKGIYGQLPDELRRLCTTDASRPNVYLVAAAPDQIKELLENAGIPWDRDALRKRLVEAESGVALDDIQYSGANEPIDFSSLSLRQNKRLVAATIYADVDGFTNYVASKTDDEQRVGALRVFHAIRRESGRIASSDYDGVQVQFQGDRIQVIANVPKDDEAQIAQTAIEIAVALNTAMETSLPDAMGDDMTLHYAIGVDLGTTLASRFGQRGDRDNVCLGQPVANAAMLQERYAKAKQIVISGKVYDLLPNAYAKQFEKIPDVDAYVSKGLTLRETEKARNAEKYATIGIVGAVAVAGGLIAAAAAASKPRPLEPPPKSWSP